MASPNELRVLILLAMLLSQASSSPGAEECFTLGSHYQHVASVQGKPDGVDRYSALGYEVWSYGLSSVNISIRSGRVIEWHNSGDLKVELRPGRNVTRASHFTRGSHRDDVLRLQGTPDDINRYSALGYEVWSYGLSTVEMGIGTGRVLEWHNSGKLKAVLSPGANVTKASHFTRGSHRDDVLRLQGTPNDINHYSALGYEVWSYGLSTVNISTRTNRVDEWDNNGNLKVLLRPGRYVTSAAQFTQGSHSDDVLRLQGTPDNINRYSALGYEVWNYGLSTVKVSTKTSRVIEWNNNGHLQVILRPGRHVTTAIRFTQGSHKDDVLRLQGTPSDIKLYPALGYELWRYGLSTVKLSTRTGLVVEFSDSGQLMAVASPGFERPVEYHHKAGDVRLYYDATKAYTGIFSLTDEEMGELYGVTRDGVVYFYDKSLRPLDLYAYVTHSKKLAVGTFRNSWSQERVSAFSSRLSHIDITGDVSASGTAMQFGNTTFYDLVSDSGTSVYGSSIDFDAIGFDDFYTSTGTTVSGSRIHVGAFTFGDWRSSRGTATSGTSHRIGNMIFHDFYSSDGTSISGTTLEIGPFSFTDISEW